MCLYCHLNISNTFGNIAWNHALTLDLLLKMHLLKKLQLMWQCLYVQLHWRMPMHMSAGAWNMRNTYRWSVAHAFILHNIMFKTVTLNYASISAVYVFYAMKTCFYTYATIAAAVFCIYRHALSYIMYIEACFHIPVPEIYGYNVNMSLHGCLCTIYIQTYTQVSPSM